jgi:hypothetical protein
MTTIPTKMFGIPMGSQGSTLQYGNFEDENLKSLRNVLYLAILDSHQFLQVTSDEFLGQKCGP